MRNRILAEKAVQRLVIIAKGELDQASADDDALPVADDAREQADVEGEASGQEVSIDAGPVEEPDLQEAADITSDDVESTENLEAAPAADADTDKAAGSTPDDQEAPEAEDSRGAATVQSSEPGESE